MKTTFIMAALLLGFSLSQSNLNAQSTPAPDKSKTGNKGHFIFGTDLASYTNGMDEEKYYTGGALTYTYKTTYNYGSLSFSAWAGYFVSNRVCVGLNYNIGQNNTGVNVYLPYGYYYYYSNIVPASLFFRLYLTNGDSSHVAIFLEGNLGVSYTGGSYDDDAVNSNSTPEPINTFTLNGQGSCVFSFNVSKHFSILAKLGVLLGYQSFQQPSYVQGAATQPENSYYIVSPAFIATAGLQYKL